MEPLRGALPFFPLVGLGLGAGLVLLDTVLGWFLARPLVDFALVAWLVLASGVLHFDGLVDTADGLLGPGPAERRLAVMRESWAGPRGVVAGLGLLVTQYAALQALPPAQRTAALLLAPLLGRWAIVYGYVVFPYARRAASLSLVLKQGAGLAGGASATAIAAGVAILVSWPGGLLLLVLAAILAHAGGEIARQRLGGMSGDVYGAVEQVVETSVLLTAPLFLGLSIR